MLQHCASIFVQIQRERNAYECDCVHKVLVIKCRSEMGLLTEIRCWPKLYKHINTPVQYNWYAVGWKECSVVPVSFFLFLGFINKSIDRVFNEQITYSLVRFSLRRQNQPDTSSLTTKHTIHKHFRNCNLTG